MSDFDEHNPTDAELQRLLKQRLGPHAFTDDELEQLLNDAVADPLPEDQVGRILASTQRLQQDSRRFTVTNRISRYSGPAKPGRNTEVVMRRLTDFEGPGRHARGAVVALVLSSLSLLAVVVAVSQHSVETRSQTAATEQQELTVVQSDWMTARPLSRPDIHRVAVGDTIDTSHTERRRVGLPDGSVLFVNASTTVEVVAARLLRVSRGDVFVEVVPRWSEDTRVPFVVETPQRTVTAIGTKFAVTADQKQTDVLVTQGQVKVSGEDEILQAGQQLKARGKDVGQVIGPSPRASAALDWTRDLICAAGSILPASQYAGGAIVTVDPSGQEMKLSLRKYHVDVHIEDGFARTTIDQTYFNHTSSRLEGTFHFPLPADASLSRLAMYVNGKLMEGGMAERQHARNTFEQIVSKMKDPALLEWVDGSTFKMRVFPLEARQEKRIVLSYTQRLGTAYGKTTYRFPAGHSMDVVRDWSTKIRVKDAVGARWESPSHEMSSTLDGHDLILEATEQHSRMDRDIVLELKADSLPAGDVAWASADHEEHQYLMMRFRPELAGESAVPSRHWIFLFEASGNREPLLARTQIEVIRALLDNAEHSDTFSIVTANTQTKLFREQPVPCSAKNIADAVQFMERTHLVGALNLELALQTAAQCAVVSGVENTLVHTGAALPVLGQHRPDQLLTLIPEQTTYVGVGVGKRWSRAWMKQAAGQTGGWFTQINPDEDTAWRAFELFSALNAPRLQDVKVTATSDEDGNGPVFFQFADTVVDGEEICAAARVAANQQLPQAVTVTGKLQGKPWRKKLVVGSSEVDAKADYLPRTWAKLAIDWHVENTPGSNKQAIIDLSKSMYVMSPYTSLLVLENEAMYAQYNIDRGRKDHWALYPCAEQIEVVHEPIKVKSRSHVVGTNAGIEHPLQSIRWLPAPQVTTVPVRQSSQLRGREFNIGGSEPRFLGRLNWNTFPTTNPSTGLPWFVDFSGPESQPAADVSSSVRDFGFTVSGVRSVAPRTPAVIPLAGNMTAGLPIFGRGDPLADRLTALDDDGDGNADWISLGFNGRDDNALWAFGDPSATAEEGAPILGLPLTGTNVVRSSEFERLSADVSLFGAIRAVSPGFDSISNGNVSGPGAELFFGTIPKEIRRSVADVDVVNGDGIQFNYFVGGTQSGNGNGTPLYSMSNGGAVPSHPVWLNYDFYVGNAVADQMMLGARYMRSSETPRRAGGMAGSGGQFPVGSGQYIRGQGPQSVAGNGVHWGIPDVGTPIGLPGPPHLPLSDLGGLQSHTIRNLREFRESVAGGTVAGRPGVVTGTAAYPRLPTGGWPYDNSYPNGTAVTYPGHYRANGLPGIGPFYPQQPGPFVEWSGVPVSWEDRFWDLKFNSAANAWQLVTPEGASQRQDRLSISDERQELLSKLPELAASTESGITRFNRMPQPVEHLVESIVVPQVDYVLPHVSSWQGPDDRPRSLGSLLHPAEQAIRRALHANVSLHYDNTPVTSVLGDIVKQHGVGIVIDSAARAATNKSVSIDVDGIQLRSALKLLLQQCGDGLVTSVSDGQLVITHRDTLKFAPKSADGLLLAQTSAMFCDLLLHAPGMNTSNADVLHVLDTERVRSSDAQQVADKTDAARPFAYSGRAEDLLGRIDEDAARLIHRARELGWERITGPSDEDAAEFTLYCNGAGQYRWERVVSEGLQETVVCNGDSLLHLYPEIGLGARREYSRFHEVTIQSLVPWLVPSVEKLARDFHISSAGDSVVALTPRHVSGASNDGDQNSIAMHLVFGANGRLVEKRLVKPSDGEVLRSLRFAAGGRIELLNSKQQVVAVSNRKRVACEPPNLEPDTNELVVLPLPYRGSRPSLATDESNSTVMSGPDPLHLLGDSLAANDGKRVVAIIREHFFQKQDRRAGFYVLLSRFPKLLTGTGPVPGTDGRQARFDLRPSVEGSPLSQFIRQWMNIQRDDSQITDMDIEAPDDSFLQRMATARNVYARWTGGVATRDRTTAQVKEELNHVLKFVGGCRTDGMGWLLLQAVEQTLPHEQFGADFADAAKRFERNTALRDLVRQERARALFVAGRTKKARKIVRRLLLDQVRRGIFPYIDFELRTHFQQQSGRKTWDQLMKTVGQRLIAGRQYRMAVMFSTQLQALEETDAAAELVNQVLDEVQVTQRPDVALMAVDVVQRIDRADASDLIGRVLESEVLKSSPVLWRYAAGLADSAGQKMVALERLEQAVLLEYRYRPDVINLKDVRNRYGQLLKRFESIIEASATLDLPPPKHLRARIIRAADQWRSIDDDDTQCCRITARLLSRLNRDDLAWAYLTTPLADNAGESAPWQALAEELTKTKQYTLADAAWERAFEMEQTNPDLLLKRAQMLQQHGDMRKSGLLLNQVIDGNWQPRFSGTVQQARNLAQ